MPKVKKHATVLAPVDLVYRAWHNFENFPLFMSNIEDVRRVSGGRSHWKARAPLGTHAEWDAEVTLDEPERAIGWRSIGGTNSGIQTAGRVNFSPSGSPSGAATEIDVTIEYAAPGGVVGEVVTKIFADPERQVEEDLLRFKETIEKGVELSGMRFDDEAPRAPDDLSYGGSMGGASDADLERIENTNSGIEPSDGRS
jgi:uncharacterized membrane protein